MLRINQHSSSAGVKNYFVADYYIDGGQEEPGEWRGKAAAQLGLSGTIAQDDWEKLCDGINPMTGERLMQRLKSNRTICYDFNWHCPKSVSLLYAETRDERILDAFRDAVDVTLDDIESEMQTRVRTSGKNEDRITGNLIAGQYVHFTARPGDDGVPDPHLHIHSVVFNTTFDESEKRFKAGQFRELKRDAPYFEALIHARLSDNLSRLGLPIERTAKGWELAGLSPELLKEFSRRTTEIEKRAEKLGITDPDAKAELGAKTRNRKAKNLTFPELQAEWRLRMSPAERAALTELANRIGGETAPRDETAAKLAVDYAIAHEFERTSVTPERQLLTTALKRGIGSATPDEVVRRYEVADLIRGIHDGRRMATNADVLGEEREIVAFAKEGRGECRPLASSHPIQRDWLNESQRAAVKHILESRDRIIAVRGGAGVGKTSLMQEAVEAVEANGTRVVAVAPSASASRGVLRDEGFHEADTVARLLLDESMQEKARGQLIWVDEAGLLSTRMLRNLFRVADGLDARVLLTGDRFQHGSVQRGAAIRLLEEEAGIRPAEVKEIQRQAGEYKAAVKALSEGRVSDGFRKLDALGWIREISDDERYKLLADEYAESVRLGRTALIVSPTHREGRMINDEVRKLLRQQKILRGKEREFTTLVNAQLTEAEKTDRTNYYPGDIIEFHQNAKGFVKGQRLTVGAHPLPLDQAHRYTVFRPSQLRLAKGDMIRASHNGRSADGKHRLDNQARFTVKRFDRRGNIVLTNGMTICRDFGHFAYGYAVTSHASQAKTVDHVILGQSSDSVRASSREQFYVSASRGRHRLTVFTDDKAALLEAVQQHDERLTATEFARRKQRERDRRSAWLEAERSAASQDRHWELTHER